MFCRVVRISVQSNYKASLEEIIIIILILIITLFNEGNI